MSFDNLSLECFLAVADLGSFTLAAQKVYRTQSAVSQQIAKLESLLDKPLFTRGKRLTLTHDGEIFLTYARKIVKLNREAIDRFRHPELQGEVRFGLPEDFASVFLEHILVDYTELHPLILLNIECDLTLNLFDRFKKNKLDLVLLKMNRPEDFPNGIDVWSEALEWVGSEDYFNLGKEEPIPLILSPQPCVYRARAINALERANRNWRLVFSSHSYASTIAAVRVGMGVSVLSRNMIPSDIHVIRGCRAAPQLEDAHISLLKHSNDNFSVNDFESFIIERMRPN